MKYLKKTPGALIVAIWLCAFFVGTSTATRPAAADAGSTLVVIVARSLGQSDISLQKLRSAFLGRPTHLGSKRLVPLNHRPKTPARLQFDQVILGMNSDQVGRYWVGERIRGKARPPRTVPSAALAVRVVAKLPGAITYVPAKLAGSGVTQLSIDGKRPGEPGYPLR